MENHSSCTNELVAQSAFSSITVCPKCNVYHLHIGPMSFRLDAEMFKSFSEMIVGNFLQDNSSLHKHPEIAQKH